MSPSSSIERKHFLKCYSRMNLIALPAVALANILQLFYEYFIVKFKRDNKKSLNENEKLEKSFDGEPLYECCLCQLDLFYSEFVEGTIIHGENKRRSMLGFHFDYRGNAKLFEANE